MYRVPHHQLVRQYSLFVFAISAMVVLAGCSAEENESPGQSPSTENQTTSGSPEVGTSGQEVRPESAPAVDKRTVYRPKTVDELIDAIGPNRIIELDPSVVYRIDEAKRGVSDFYLWRSPYTGEFELVIRDCPSLTIRSGGSDKTHVATRFGYAYTLAFEACDGLVLEGLRLGHDPDPGGCAGGVVQIVNSRDTLIKESLLYGCGTEGLTLNKVSGFTFERSIIEQCTYGILSTNDSRDLRFVGSTFRKNKDFWGFNFANTIGIRFEGCMVTGNIVDSEYQTRGLFATNLNTPESVIDFRGGQIVGNHAGILAKPEAALQTTDTQIKANQFIPAK